MKKKEVLKNDAKAKALIIQRLLYSYNHKQTLTLLRTDKLLGNHMPSGLAQTLWGNVFNLKCKQNDISKA